ncbi:MAG: C39 family peptidase [bacterium]
MAEPEKKGGGANIYIMLGIMLATLFLLAAASFGSGNTCTGPCPTGDTAVQPADPSDPAIAQLMSELALYNDPGKFLLANAAQLDALKARLQTIKGNIQGKKPGYANITSTELIPLIDRMVGEIDIVRQTIGAIDTVSKNKRTTAAKQFIADSKTLNQLLPGGATACDQGGTCLDVPLLIQGGHNWCAMTSALMIMMYLAHGDHSRTPLSNHVEITKGHLTSAHPDGEVFNAVSSPSYVNAVARQYGKSANYDFASASSANQLYNLAVKSINGGYPFNIYTRGTFYGTVHVVVVTGYNPANKSLYVNNPITWPAGSIKNANTGRFKHVLTADFVFSTLGKQGGGKNGGGHDLLVNKSFL